MFKSVNMFKYQFAISPSFFEVFPINGDPHIATNPSLYY